MPRRNYKTTNSVEYAKETILSMCTFHGETNGRRPGLPRASSDYNALRIAIKGLRRKLVLSSKRGKNPSCKHN